MSEESRALLTTAIANINGIILRWYYANLRIFPQNFVNNYMRVAKRNFYGFYVRIKGVDFNSLRKYFGYVITKYSWIFSMFTALWKFCFGAGFYNETEGISWKSLEFQRKIVEFPKRWPCHGHLIINKTSLLSTPTELCFNDFKHEFWLFYGFQVFWKYLWMNRLLFYKNISLFYFWI